MLQMRARGFALRDVFPDALRGVVTVEEAQDIPPPDTEPRFVPSEPVAEPEPERPVIDPAALVSASSYGIEALDHGLAACATPDCVRAYLADPHLRSWLDRTRRNRPAEAEQAQAIIGAAWARVDPDSRDAGDDEIEGDAPVGSWVIVGSTGNTAYASCGEWLDAWRARVAAIEAAPRTVEVRRAVLERMLAMNAEVFRHLQRIGAGAAVLLDAQGISAAADGRLANGAALAAAAE
jgi:hypothetical protein